MDKNFFEYTCTYWDEVTKKLETVHGIVHTNCFTNAMYEIGKVYGEDNIQKIFFSIGENFDTNVYEFEASPESFSLTVEEREKK